MDCLSERERSGCRKLLQLLSDNELFALSDTVTNRLIVVKSVPEAIDAVLAYSQCAEELLKRKKVYREVIFKYLAAEGVTVPVNTEKHQLVKRTLQYWQSSNDSPSQTSVQTYTADCSKEDGLADLTALGKQFCQWFYQLLNSQNPTAGQPVQDWGPQHFWKDAKLMILTFVGDHQEEQFSGADLVSQRLYALTWNERLFFCPNLETTGLKCVSSPHGLVLVACAGTIHQESACLGIFEQVFGLIRDPMDNNRWKVKLVHLKVTGQGTYGKGMLPAVTYESNELLELFT